jgi:hypothetical protein
MEDFNRYFDQIKAETELKEKTKQYLRETLAKKEAPLNRQRKAGYYMNKGMTENKDTVITKFPVRRAVFAASGVVLALAFAVAGYIYYKAPVNYISLDINPSVELALNTFDRVVGVEAMNADGLTIIEGERLNNLSVESAVRLLVQNAWEDGFVNEDGSSVIAITVFTDDEDKALILQEEGSAGTEAALSEDKAYAAIYTDCSDLELRTEAKESGLSPGKYKLIKMLQVMDPDITTEQYRDIKVSDIISKANELAQGNSTVINSNADFQGVIARVQTTVQEMSQNRIHAEEQNQEEEQNQNGSSSTSQNQEEEQNQNGSSQTSQNQNGTSGGTGTSQQSSSQNPGASNGSSIQSGNTSQAQNSGSTGQASQAGGNPGSSAGTSSQKGK